MSDAKPSDVAYRKDAAERETGLWQATRWLQVTSDALFVADLDGRIFNANEEAERLYGWPRAELIGKSVDIIVPENRLEQAEDLWIRCSQGESIRNVESVRQNRDGEQVPVRLTLTRLTGENGQPCGVGVVTRDISALKQVEARLRRMTRVFMESATPMSILDLQGRVLDLNPASEHLFGWTREERLGQHPKSLLAPEYHKLVDDAIQRSLNGESVSDLQIDAQTRDGHDVSLLVTTSRLTDENDEPIGVAVVSKDVTDLRRTTRDLERTAEELERSNRELREFAFALSHDLQEPIRSIIGFGELLSERCGQQLDEEAGEYLDFITTGASNLRLLIDDLLSYASLSRSSRPLADTDCNAACDRAIRQLHAAIEESGATVTRDELPSVHADALQITLLFQNLIGNAIKYRQGAPPTVHISAELIDNEWRFTVRDNGIGIADENAHKIFEIFRRLHSRDEIPGTGIGLSTCKKIVERHGGRIWVEANVGEGSVFYFTIPN